MCKLLVESVSDEHGASASVSGVVPRTSVANISWYGKGFCRFDGIVAHVRIHWYGCLRITPVITGLRKQSVGSLDSRIT